MKLSAIATVTGTVAASAAIGRLAASMLETAITSSIRNIISVLEATSRPAGRIRIAVQVRPYSRSSSTKRVRHLRVAGSDDGSARNFEQLRIITAWMQSMPQVQAAADTGCIQKPNSAPVATTSSMTTNDADIRVCAYWRKSSVSKAGRVPLDDVNRSRASRTRCADARRALTGAAGAGSAGSWTTSGFSAGLLIRQHNCARELRGLLHYLSVALNV